MAIMSKHERKTKQVVVMRKDLNMRKGKMCAQAAHASIAFLTNHLRDGYSYEDLNNAEHNWIESAFVKICVGVDSEEELLTIYHAALDAGLSSTLITDAGFTEFNGVPTLTCCGIGPDWNEKINAVTGHLKLL